MRKRKGRERMETVLRNGTNEQELGVRALVKDIELDFLPQEGTRTKCWSSVVEENDRQRILTPLIQTGERSMDYNIYGEMLDMLINDTSEIELGR